MLSHYAEDGRRHLGIYLRFHNFIFQRDTQKQLSFINTHETVVVFAEPFSGNVPVFGYLISPPAALAWPDCLDLLLDVDEVIFRISSACAETFCSSRRPKKCICKNTHVRVHRSLKSMFSFA